MLLDYRIIQAATDWTADVPWHRTVTYVMAELLIFIFPLVLYLLWKQPEKKGRFHSARKAVMMALMATVLGLAIKAGISILWVRPRPFISHLNLPHMLLNLDPPSFPSSHVLVTMAIATSLLFSGYPKLGWFLIGISALIAAGRVLAGAHYPSDVASGLLIGLIISWYLHSEASSIRKYLPNR